MNLPNRPVFSTRFPPHVGQTPWKVSSTTDILPSLSTSTFFLFLHSGRPLHTRYSPFLPQRWTIGFPHLSQMISVGRSSFFRFFISCFAADISSLNTA